MLTIWGRKTSSNVQALMWYVGELGLDYQRFDMGHRFGGLDTPEFAALNPNRTIPVLRDGTDAPIWETGAILRYLAATYGVEAFWPSSPAARAQVDKWAEWAKLNVALAFAVPIFWRVVRTRPAEHDVQATADAVTRFEAALDIAACQMEQFRFLVSDHLTLADIQFGHVLFRYYDIAIRRREIPQVRSYYDRLTERPAFRDHVMVSYDELRVD